MSQEYELREKLWVAFENKAMKMTGEIDEDYVAFEDIAIDMEPDEWSSFHFKWKRYLIRNKINRTSIGNSLNYFQEDSTARWRNIPGYYSILDPVGMSERTRQYFVLDVPRDLGDKILTLGYLP